MRKTVILYYCFGVARLAHAVALMYLSNSVTYYDTPYVDWFVIAVFQAAFVSIIYKDKALYAVIVSFMVLPTAIVHAVYLTTYRQYDIVVIDCFFVLSMAYCSYVTRKTLVGYIDEKRTNME